MDTTLQKGLESSSLWTHFLGDYNTLNDVVDKNPQFVYVWVFIHHNNSHRSLKMYCSILRNRTNSTHISRNMLRVEWHISSLFSVWFRGALTKCGWTFLCYYCMDTKMHGVLRPPVPTSRNMSSRTLEISHLATRSRKAPERRSRKHGRVSLHSAGTPGPPRWRHTYVSEV